MSKTRIEINHYFSGQTFVFNNGNLDNFDNILDVVKEGDECIATLSYSGDKYSGAAAVVGASIVVSFDNKVTVPAGACIDIECKDKEENKFEENFCRDVEITATEDTKLAVLDENGCLKGWVKVSDIINKVQHPHSLCDLYGTKIPHGNLVASDKILTMSDDCMIKTVPITDIVCE